MIIWKNEPMGKSGQLVPPSPPDMISRALPPHWALRTTGSLRPVIRCQISCRELWSHGCRGQDKSGRVPTCCQADTTTTCPQGISDRSFAACVYHGEPCSSGPAGRWACRAVRPNGLPCFQAKRLRARANAIGRCGRQTEVCSPCCPPCNNRLVSP